MKPYYQHGGITIYNADCRDVLPHLPKCDLLLCDPPYGILAKSGSAATRRSGGNKDNGHIAWDISPDSEFISQLLLSSNSAMIWGGCHLELPPTFGYLIWDKQIDGLNFGEAEFCWTNGRFAPRIFRYRAVGIDGGKVHPTQKPIALMKWCLSFFPNAKTVLDPFCGSGTTLVAAKAMGLTAIGIELHEPYAEIAAKRLSQEVFDFSPLSTIDHPSIP
jgi:DNA modification methylase